MKKDWNLTKDIIRDRENTDVLLVGSVKEFIKILQERTFYASTNNHKPLNPDVKHGGGEVVWLDDILELAGDRFVKVGVDE